MSVSAYGLTMRDWENTFDKEGFSRHALPIWLGALYRSRHRGSQQISGKMLEAFRLKMSLDLPVIVREQGASDGTLKLQMRFSDGLEVETVLLPFFKKYTVCLSTQVGCGMNCSFCYTGTQGLKRNLSAGEIVGQYLKAMERAKTSAPTTPKANIVFMGQGEPLHNLIEVEKAINVLADPLLAGVGHRQMTLSTVGYLPALKALRDFPRINIALSLHSPFENERNLLIPVNRQFPLKEVLSELFDLPLLKRQFITIEYLMIKDFNMNEAHIEELSKILYNKKVLINLIPFNPFPGSRWDRPSTESIEIFRQKLVEKKLRVMVRQTKGDEVLAACGQLKINEMARKHGK